jgi:hypothetical protein
VVGHLSAVSRCLLLRLHGECVPLRPHRGLPAATRAPLLTRGGVCSGLVAADGSNAATMHATLPPMLSVIEAAVQAADNRLLSVSISTLLDVIEVRHLFPAAQLPRLVRLAVVGVSARSLELATRGHFSQVRSLP